MASIFKPTPNSKRWYISFYDADGVRHREKGYADKRATETLAAELVKKAERKHAGLTDTFAEHAKRPLAEHVADYRRYLEAKGNTAKHVELTVSRVSTSLAECGWVQAPDMKPSALVEFIGRLRRPTLGEDGEEQPGLSIQTCNFYQAAVKGFSRWLWRDGRIAADPLAGLSKLANGETDIRHARRNFSAEELQRILAAAKDSRRTFRGLTGEDRFMLYWTATGTGFRCEELSLLKPESFDLGDSPTVEHKAAYNKNKKRAFQPIAADLAAGLRDYLAGKPAGEAIWPGTWIEKAAKMLGKDMAVARKVWLESVQDARQRDDLAKGDFLAYQDSEGRYGDFHALRHTFVSNLVSSGASPKTAQTLARHSTVQLTLGRYAHANLFDLNAAVNALPSLTPKTTPEAVRLAATGTDGGKIFGLPACPKPDNSRDSVRRIETETGQGDDGLSDAKTLENAGNPDNFQGSLQLPPVGFEPTPYGLGNRRSIP